MQFSVVAVIKTEKYHVAFTEFQKIDEESGWHSSVEKTKTVPLGNLEEVIEFVRTISFQSNDPLNLDYVPSIQCEKLDEKEDKGLGRYNRLKHRHEIQVTQEKECTGRRRYSKAYNSNY